MRNGAKLNSVIVKIHRSARIGTARILYGELDTYETKRVYQIRLNLWASKCNFIATMKGLN